MLCFSQSWYAELDKLRAKLLDAACIDLAYTVSQHALEVVRRRVEAAARLAREQASLTLLRELEEEEAAKRDSGSAAGGAGGKKSAKNSKKASKVDKQKEKKEKEELEKLVSGWPVKVLQAVAVSIGFR